MVVRVLLLTAAFVFAGCDFPRSGPLYIEMTGRTPVPVDAEVDKVLTEWQKHRAGKKSLYAKFNQTVLERAFKTERHNQGILRYRHPDLARLDILANEKGEGREVILWTKSNELWHAIVRERKIQIHQFDHPYLFDFLRGSQYAWLVPTDKETLQRLGPITKIRDDASSVALQVKAAGRTYANESVDFSLAVQLRKSDFLPTRLVVNENVDTKITWEFTELHEDVEFDESDFTLAKLDTSKWSVARVKWPIEKGKPAPVPGSALEKESRTEKPTASKKLDATNNGAQAKLGGEKSGTDVKSGTGKQK